VVVAVLLLLLLLLCAISWNARTHATSSLAIMMHASLPRQLRSHSSAQLFRAVLLPQRLWPGWRLCLIPVLAISRAAGCPAVCC
jgi:hypothetical protein